MKIVVTVHQTDGFTYGFDHFICINYPGLKEEFALELECHIIMHATREEQDRNSFFFMGVEWKWDWIFFIGDKEKIDYVMPQIQTLDEWFDTTLALNIK